jgi:ubiquitin-like 1-activating enzyme E1 B
LFGTEDPDEAVSPDTEDPENNANLEKNQKKSDQRISTRKWAEDTDYNPSRIFNKVSFWGGFGRKMN